MTVDFRLIDSGNSRSFPAGDPFLANATVAGAALHQMLGTPGFVPARRAQIAAKRRHFQVNQKKNNP